MINQVKKLFGIEPKSTTNTETKNLFSVDWVIPRKLAIGRLPQAGDGEQLLKANIKTVLSLCAEQEGVLPQEITQNFQCFRVVLPDRHYTTEMTAEQLAEAVNIVHESIQKNSPIFVHCLAGIERSPTVCIAYLCKYHKMELWEAANWLKQVHSSSLPNDSGLRAIRELLQQK
ncbi:dual specificity protein phosphatase family protein [Phormidium sp. LEGE 05292]|uniref:dual specificity protein phosphatase family protein n=1 Tax=[Phormidium] sp. LEGE 05292 TaxID=767427 RepID=UPI0018810C79|nr:dual specificity protein phosphatase [Phormidium sp. LEGE 05292]MBE9227763.1 dual specificity protein phosphatase family protein [Phormidium sp. LEGE 05292]